jgi:thiamine pyrophosphokinase
VSDEPTEAPPATTMPGDRPPFDVIVLAGGEPVEPPLPRPLPAASLVVAADGGIAAARALGLPVHVLIGDLDSVDPDDLADAERTGVRIERHPVDKDRTDLALALDHAVDAGATSITVVGGHGGRLDHLAGNLALLAAADYAGVAVTGLLGAAIVTVVHTEATLHGAVGDTVSLLATHGSAGCVSTDGLAFALDDATLQPGSSLGLSNRFTAPHARVRVGSGTVLAIQPGAHA